MREKRQMLIEEGCLNLGIQERMNVSNHRAQYIVDYIKMVSKGPENFCDVLKEIPLNFKGNEKFFAVYVVTLFIIHHSDKFKKEKQEIFLNDIWEKAAKCLGLNMGKYLDILSIFIKKDAKKDVLSEIINGQFEENEKIFLLFLFNISMLGSLRQLE